VTRERRLLLVLFVVYLVLLAWIILWKLEPPYIGKAALLPRPIKLVPFLPSGDYRASNPLEVAFNVILFVPFGIYLGMLAPSWRWYRLTAVFLGASLLLETVQHLLSTGSFDLSDVISNGVGGVAGIGVLVVARRWLGARTIRVLTGIGLIAAVVSVLAVTVYIASPLHYTAQRDVVVPQPATSSTP
jgi:glycopeptide antibiotics resistance protein